MSRKTSIERGFTLVELLVVIGIIALLISVLLPALGKAKDAAAAVKCASGMKQVLTAAMMYAADNKSSFPVPPSIGEDYVAPKPPIPLMYYMDKSTATGQASGAGIIRYDVGTLWPYLSTAANKTNPNTVSKGPESLKQIMNCPSDSESLRMMQWGTTQAVARNYSYSWNVLIRGYPGSIYDPTDTSAASKTTQVKSPSQKIILLEEASPNDGVCWIGRPSTANAVISSTTTLAGNTDDTPAYRHGYGRGNYGFADAHVEKLDGPTIGFTVVKNQTQQATIADDKKIRYYFLPTLKN